MITTINAADPPLQKIDLDLQGMNGDLGKSDREAIAATLRNGKAESLAWSKIGPKALGKVLSLAVRGENGGDWLAAGLLTLNDQDVQTAERCFDKRSRWAPIVPPIAACWRPDHLRRSKTAWASTSMRRAARCSPRWMPSMESSPGSPRTSRNWMPPQWM